MLLTSLQRLLQSTFIKLAQDQGPEVTEKLAPTTRQGQCPLRKLLPQESNTRRRTLTTR